MKKIINRNNIRCEIIEDENRKLDLTLIMPEWVREKYLLNENEVNFKRFFKRIEIITDEN